MKDTHVVDEVRVRPADQLKALADYPKHKLNEDEDDDDQPNDEMPLLVLLILLCWDSLLDENRKGSDEGGQ